MCYVLKASSFAMRESLWLEGLICHLQSMIYNHVHTHTHKHTDAHTHLSKLPHNKCVKKRARKDRKNLCPFCSREQGTQMCQSFFTRRAFVSCFQNWQKMETKQGFLRQKCSKECRMLNFFIQDQFFLSRIKPFVFILP